MSTNPPQKAADFDIIYNPNGTCGYRWDCGKTGVVLAYDVFSPESATWFCADCWQEANEDMPADWLSIVEDKRTKEQAILEAAQKNDDNLMDLLQEAIEMMDEAQAERLMDKVHQVQSENLRDIRGWTEEVEP